MPFNNPPPDLMGMLVALIISLVSGFISIGRRIVNGHPVTILWLIVEIVSAVLCGYIMYHAFPIVRPLTPDWFTMPLAVSLSAYIGGRLFQEIESEILSRYFNVKRRKDDPDD